MLGHPLGATSAALGGFRDTGAATGAQCTQFGQPLGGFQAPESMRNEAETAGNGWISNGFPWILINFP